jgi:hypothetical protein
MADVVAQIGLQVFGARAGGVTSKAWGLREVIGGPSALWARRVITFASRTQSQRRGGEKDAVAGRRIPEPAFAHRRPGLVAG